MSSKLYFIVGGDFVEDGSGRVTDAIIKASYRDKIVGQSFVNHVVEVYAHTNRLQHKHSSLKVFLRRAAHAVRSRFDLDDEIEIYTAMVENLLGEDVAIWSNIDEPGKLLSLDEL